MNFEIDGVARFKTVGIWSWVAHNTNFLHCE